MITPIISSGGAEILGALFLLFSELIVLLIGSAISAAFSALATTAVALSGVHALGLTLAAGGHRLERTGHWLLRPLLWSAALGGLAVGCLATNLVLLGGALLSESTSSWMALAPISALLPQLAAGVIGGLWLCERLAGVLGDLIGAGREGIGWRRAQLAGRWTSAVLGGLAGIGLSLGSLVGLLIVPPLLLVADAGSVRGVLLHGVVMLVGLLAGGRLLLMRISRLRAPSAETDWTAGLREAAPGGPVGQVLLSLAAWLLGEAVAWTGGAGLMLALMLTVAMIASPGSPAVIGVIAGLAALSAGLLWLGRIGGRLRVAA